MNSLLLTGRALTGHYRQHPWQLLLMWLGITLGVATVISIELLNDSARQSIVKSHNSLDQTASHTIEGDAVLLEKFYREIQLTIPGIIATPLLIAKVNHQDSEHALTLVGIDPFTYSDFGDQVSQQFDKNNSLRSLLINKNTALVNQFTFDELNLSIGSELVLWHKEKPFRLIVHSVLESAPSTSDNLLIMDIGQAKKNLGKENELSQIKLRLDLATVFHKNTENQREQQRNRILDNITSRLPAGLYLDKPGRKTNNLLQMRRSFELSLNALSGMALMMGLFLVYNSSHFGFLQRQPMLAQLRAMGVTSNEIGFCLFIEYIVLAISAALSAIPIGWLLADSLLELMVSGHIESSNSLPRLSISTIFQALSLGVFGSLLACIMPLVTAPRTGARPFGNNLSASLTDDEKHHWPLFFGVLLLIAASAILSIRDTSIVVSYAGIALMMFGCAILSPLAYRLILHLLDRVQRRLFPHHWLLQLTVRESTRNLSRTRVALMALMIAIATSYGMQLMVGSFRLSVENWLDERLNAPIYLRMQQTLSTPAEPIPSHLLSLLKQQSNIDAVAEFSFQKVWVGNRQVEMIINNFPLQTRSGYRLLADNNRPPWPQLLHETGIMISEPMAYHLELAVNDKIIIELDGKNSALNIVGIFQDYGSEQGRLIISRNTYNSIWDTQPATAAGIYGSITIQSILALLSDDEQKSIKLIDQKALRNLSLKVFDQTFAITYALQLVAVTVAFMGLFSSLLAILLERREQMSIYHHLGLSGQERSFLILGEGLLIGASAGIIAIACGEWLAWLLLKVINLKAFGWNLPLTHSAFGWLQPVVLGVLAALLATSYPAWKFSKDPRSDARKS